MWWIPLLVTVLVTAALATYHVVRRRSRLSAVLDHLHDGVILLDVDGNVLMANGRAVEFLSLNSYSGTRIRMSLARVPNLTEYIHSVRLGGGEGEGITVDVGYPEVRHLRIGAAALASGEIVLTLTDVTRIYKLERMRRQFTADISHQLRTPVTSIRLLGEGIQDRADNANADDVQRIMKETLRLENLINEILILSRLEAGEVELRPELVSMSQLVTEAAEPFRSQMKTGGVSMIIDIEDDQKWWVDYERLLRVLSIYLDNALKFSPSGESIRVAAYTEGNLHILQVSDCGPGIPRDELSQVFQRFYRGSSQQVSEPGFGLGLAIAKHTIAFHGGEVFAKSQLGRGSTFGFKLPVARDPDGSSVQGVREHLSFQ